MGASTVTGKGFGESYGLAKPESNTGCCGQKPPEEIPIVEPKRSCYTRFSASNKVNYKLGSSSRIRVCQ